VYRPAAIKQLQVLGEKVKVPVFSLGNKTRWLSLGSFREARREAYDTVLIDTAGRLHIDEEMMTELVEIKMRSVQRKPVVLDAMTGQDAVTAAGAFQEKLVLPVAS